jgi:hypothetical protein
VRESFWLWSEPHVLCKKPAYHGCKRHAINLPHGIIIHLAANSEGKLRQA